MDMVKTIKNAIDANKITIGTDVTLKNLNQGKLDSAIIASNCPADIKRDIEKAAKLSDLKIQTFEGTSIELGATARKPFSITVLGIKK
ncbi:MAG: 50S ribosomal protein L30e [archaeon]